MRPFPSGRCRPLNLSVVLLVESIPSYRALGSAPSSYEYGCRMHHHYFVDPPLLIPSSLSPKFASCSRRGRSSHSFRVCSSYCHCARSAASANPQSFQNYSPGDMLYVPPASPYPEAIVAVFKWGSRVAMCCRCELGQLGLRQQRTVLPLRHSDGARGLRCSHSTPLHRLSKPCLRLFFLQFRLSA